VIHLVIPQPERERRRGRSNTGNGKSLSTRPVWVPVAQRTI
jgi:hypothetical protein